MYALSKRIFPLALASLAALGLTLPGCASSVSLAPTAAPSMTGAPPADTDAHPHRHNGEDDHPSAPIPEAGPVSQTDAISAATDVLTAFARPDLDEAQWWNELLPLLSQKGAVAYQATLPSNIPVTAVTGPGTVLAASTNVATLVEVPTDVGPYVVSLTRSSPEQPWLTERIRPAGQ